MEPPFSVEDIQEILDVTEWFYRRSFFYEDTEDYPDGTNPYEIQQKWLPWVKECIVYMLDGYCTFRRFKYDLPFNEQPAVDIEIYRIIKSKYIELRNSKNG